MNERVTNKQKFKPRLRVGMGLTLLCVEFSEEEWDWIFGFIDDEALHHGFKYFVYLVLLHVSLQISLMF